MTRLLWKEWRERRLWALSWTASILSVSLLAHGQNCCGERQFPLTPWLALPLALALLTGAGAYASELTGERATFVFSRPLSARALLCAKLLFGAIIFLGTPLLAAVLLRFTIPAPLQHLATPAHLLAGAWTMTWMLALCYLFGLACSVVLPGLAGGILTVTAVAVVLAAALVLAPICKLGNNLGIFFVISMLSLGAWLGALCAGIPVAHFGLTLGANERVKRFAPIYTGTLLALGLIGILLPNQWIAHWLLHWTPVNTDISPGGKYALVYYERRIKPLDYLLSGDIYQQRFTQQGFGECVRIIRMADGASMLDVHSKDNYLLQNLSYNWCWVSDDTAYFFDYQDQSFHVAHIDKRLIAKVDMQREGYSFLKPSPDGRMLLGMTTYTTPATTPNTAAQQETRLSLIDLTHDRWLGYIYQGNAILPWWQSDTQIGYRDSEKHRHSIAVPQG